MSEQNSVPERGPHTDPCNEHKDIPSSGRPPDHMPEPGSPPRTGNRDDFNIGDISAKDLVINMMEKNIVRRMGNGNVLVNNFEINVSAHNITLHIGNGDVLANDFITNLVGNNVELYVGSGNPPDQIPGSRSLPKARSKSADDFNMGDVLAMDFVMNMKANNAVLHAGNGHVLASEFVVNVSANNIVVHLGTGDVSAENFLANVSAKNLIADIWAKGFSANVSAKNFNIVVHTGKEDGHETPSPPRMLRGPESPLQGGKRCRDFFDVGDVLTGNDFVINAKMMVSCPRAPRLSRRPGLTYENRNGSPANIPRAQNIPDEDSSPKRDENSAHVDTFGD